MNFCGPPIGGFVYYCHILEPEDSGMMAIVGVIPRRGAGWRSPKLGSISRKIVPPMHA
jgi:hypothetical protein